MTQRNAPDLDLVLGAFLGEGPLEAPDRAIEDALETIVTTGQIRRPWMGGRFTMPRQLRLVAAAAAILVFVALAAFYAGNRQSTPNPLPSLIPTAATPGPVASPSPTPAPSPTAAAADPMLSLILAAETELDHAVVATLGQGGLNPSEEGSLLQLLDDMNLALTEGHVRPPTDLFDRFVAKVDQLAAKIQSAILARIRADTTTYGALLHSTPFVAGMTAGVHYSEQFVPNVVLTMPDGWNPGGQDREGLVIKRGLIWMAFDFQGPTSVSEASATVNGHVPTAVTFGEFSGFEETYPIEAGPAVTLYIDSGLRANDTRDGDATHTWLIDFRGRPLTIVLTGLAADVTAALPEVRAMLQTLQSP